MNSGRRILPLAAMAGALCLGLAACGGAPSAPIMMPPLGALSVQPAVASLTATQGGASATVSIAVVLPAGDAGSTPITLAVTGAPVGVTVTVSNPAAGAAGSLAFAAAASTPAGTYALTVKAADGVTSGQAALSLVVAIAASVGAAAGQPLGAFLSTSFQPASWDDQFFVAQPNAPALLNALEPQHIRLQPVDGDVPESAPGVWDFTALDRVVQPVLAAADHSPEFQIAVAPSFMYDATGALADPTYQQFAAYCQDLVRYYNTGGFTDPSGQHHVSPSSQPILWWGIFNEPNLNHMTAAEYTRMYNVVVPAMQAVDPRLHFVAVELSDFGTEPQKFLPTFVAGVTAEVDAVATHFYSTCDQATHDQALFDTVPPSDPLTGASGYFVAHIQYFRQELATNAKLAAVPIWVTENNVNADYDKGGGISACNGTAFTLDPRGSDAFFAAWRPYVFSRLAQAGAAALYHWDFDADAQFGEVDGATGQTYLSYWVDYWLGRELPATATVLPLTATETADVELLAVRRSDGSVVVMMDDHAVAQPADNNGPGAPRSVVVDLSALGNFASASWLVLDTNTSSASGPQPAAVTPAVQMTLTLGGYGVGFLTLQP